MRNRFGIRSSLAARAERLGFSEPSSPSSSSSSSCDTVPPRAPRTRIGVSSSKRFALGVRVVGPDEASE